MKKHIIKEDSKGILTVTLNRLDKKNAITPSMYQELIDCFIFASQSEHIRCLLIKGSVDCFSAGNDFTEPAGSEPLAFKFIEILAEFDKPIVAAVAGAIVGIGVTMLLHCDMVIAASNSKFIFPFTQLGICLEAGSSLLLPQRIGYNRAFELAILGEPFGAELAFQYGIVNKVCQPDELVDAAVNIAQSIAKLPADSVQTSRRLLRQSTDKLMLDVLENEKNEVTRLLQTDYCQSILNKFAK